MYSGPIVDVHCYGQCLKILMEAVCICSVFGANTQESDQFLLQPLKG